MTQDTKVSCCGCLVNKQKYLQIAFFFVAKVNFMRVSIAFVPPNIFMLRHWSNVLLSFKIVKNSNSLTV